MSRYVESFCCSNEIRVCTFEHKRASGVAQTKRNFEQKQKQKGRQTRTNIEKKETAFEVRIIEIEQYK
jgi:hypothetical protein